MSTAPQPRPSEHPRLKIAVVTETYPPEINGVATTIGVMVQGLIERGHQVDLIRPRQPHDGANGQRPVCPEVLVRSLPLPGYSALRFGMPAGRTLKARWLALRPDVVQVVTEGPLGWSAVRTARTMRIPVCSDFHTNFHAYTTHYNAGWLYRPIASYLRRLHNATASTMVPTEELRDCLSHFGFERVTVVSRGVDTALFSPSRRSDELRRQWGADADTTVVILVGRLAAEKNLDLLFHAFDALRARRPQARLVVVGDGPERRRLEQQYPGHCFCGIRTGESLAAHYASADVFLYPSLSETFGNVTIEAMASALAVLAYDYGAAREHIRHDVNGLVAPFGDEASFLQQAAALGHEPDRIERLRRAARKRAETFDWNSILDALETTLLAVASGPDVPGNSAALVSESAP